MSMRYVLMVLGFVWVSSTALGQFPALIEEEDLDGTAGFSVHGVVPGEFGQKVAGIGDVNADGVDDFASGGIGIIELPPPFYCDGTAGAVYVIFGRRDIGEEGDWTLAELDGSNGFRIPGLQEGDHAGRVAPAGDFNNDGIADFLVGAPYANAPGTFLGGEAYLIYGQRGLGSNGTFDLVALNGANGFRIQGSHSWGGLGVSMDDLGDVNADGVSDVGLTSGGADPGGRINAGQGYVLFGGQGIGAGNGNFRPWEDLDPDTGVFINGINAGDYTDVIRAAGDVNGDGHPDVILQSFNAEPLPDTEGQVYLVYGGPNFGGANGVIELADLNGRNGFIVNPPPGTEFALAGGLGDVNNDGFDDIAIEVDVHMPEAYAGVIFGGPSVAPGGTFRLDDLDGTNGFRVVNASGASGMELSAIGDANHDGIVDLAAHTRVILGDPILGASGEFELSDLNGVNGFWFYMLYTRGRDSAGDVNGDGVNDMVFGREYEMDWNCETDVGAISVIFGRRMGDADMDADIDLADFDAFEACIEMPDGGDVPDACHPFDFDKDNDVDLADFGAFQTTFATEP